jgi:hypothetical protein
MGEVERLDFARNRRPESEAPTVAGAARALSFAERLTERFLRAKRLNQQSSCLARFHA